MLRFATITAICLCAKLSAQKTFSFPKIDDKATFNKVVSKYKTFSVEEISQIKRDSAKADSINKRSNWTLNATKKKIDTPIKGRRLHKK